MEGRKQMGCVNSEAHREERKVFLERAGSAPGPHTNAVRLQRSQQRARRPIPEHVHKWLEELRGLRARRVTARDAAS